MILPLRVRGTVETTTTRAGRAMAPTASTIAWASAARSSGPSAWPARGTTNATGTVPFTSSGCSHHGGFGHRGVRQERRFELHRAKTMPCHVDDVVEPAGHPELTVGVEERRVGRDIMTRKLLEVRLYVSAVVPPNSARQTGKRCGESERAKLPRRCLGAILAEDVRNIAG